jgi:hypothetical protein
LASQPTLFAQPAQEHHSFDRGEPVLNIVELRLPDLQEETKHVVDDVEQRLSGSALR